MAVPGEYGVELTVGSSTQRATLRVLKDPRLAAPLEAHQHQFDLLQELTGALSRVNGSINRIRRLKRQLGALADMTEPESDLAERAKAAMERLGTIECVLVDVHRE